MHTSGVEDEDQEKVPKDCVISTRALSKHSFLLFNLFILACLANCLSAGARAAVIQHSVLIAVLLLWFLHIVII